MSIRHATQPAEEGGVIHHESGSPFAVKREQFTSRLEEQNRAARETAAIVQAHLAALTNRLALAETAIESANLGSARAYLQIGRHDFDAALAALPEL